MIFNFKRKQEKIQAPKPEYILPDIDNILSYHTAFKKLNPAPFITGIPKIFARYNISCKVVKAYCGTSMARFTVRLDDIRDYSKIGKVQDGFRAALNNEGVTVSKDGANVYIDIPVDAGTLLLGDMLRNTGYRNGKDFSVAIGRSMDGADVFANIEDAKHILVAGTTGSGKSVFMQNVLVSILAKHGPEEADIYIIDPKRVEFSAYRSLPHCHVVTESGNAMSLLERLTDEMERRYMILERGGFRNIEGYNMSADKPMKRLFVFIDELSDLMKQTKKAVEAPIVRIAQKARACGIHLIIATQYPVRDVVTGLIKANMPTKVCFAVSSNVHSRVMLDKGGAEKLLGKGDMLFQTEKDLHPVRLQAPFISDAEIHKITTPHYAVQGRTA